MSHTLLFCKKNLYEKKYNLILSYFLEMILNNLVKSAKSFGAIYRILKEIHLFCFKLYCFNKCFRNALCIIHYKCIHIVQNNNAL